MRGYGLTAFAARRILLHPVRWLLAAGAIALVTFFASTVVLLLFAIESTATNVIERGPALVVSRVDAGGWASIDPRFQSRLEAIPGIHSVEPRVWGVLPGPPAVTVVGDPSLAGRPDIVRKGSTADPASTGELLVLRGLDGTPRELRVESAIPEQADVLAHDVVLVPPEVARSLLLLPPGRATDLAVRTARDEENDVLVPEIAEAMPHPVRVTTRAEMLGAYRVQLGRRGSLAFVALLPALLSLVLIVAAAVSGGPRTRAEVGKLKMIGWTTHDVARLHLTEMGVVGSVAVGTGLAAAYAGLFVFGGGSVATTVLGWESVQPSLRLSTEGAALSMIVIAASIIVPCLAASLVPALRLARTDPAVLTGGS